LSLFPQHQLEITSKAACSWSLQSHSGHPGSAPLVEARHTSLSLYDLPLSEQTPFLAPTNDYHFHQQWAGQGYQTFEPVFSLGNSAGPTDSIHWEGERPSHQASEAAITTTPGHSAVSWAPRSEDWSWYQELQQNRSSPASRPNVQHRLPPPLPWTQLGILLPAVKPGQSQTLGPPQRRKK
ncbi:nitrogen assimilation transcription factor, partial [Colletotrichum tofieldiae]